MQLIPEIGSVGKFSFKDPYSKLTPIETKLVCKSIRKITELLSRNESVFELHYKPHGLTEAQYKQDLKDDVSIISLQAESGVWFYVPSSYLLSYPNTNGVIYTRIILGVGLGAISDNLDLTGINAAISGLIYDQLGLRCEIKPVVASQSTVVSYEDHEKIELIRKSNIKLYKSETTLLAEAVQERNLALAKIKELELFIKNNIHKLTT